MVWPEEAGRGGGSPCNTDGYVFMNEVALVAQLTRNGFPPLSSHQLHRAIMGRSLSLKNKILYLTWKTIRSQRSGILHPPGDESLIHREMKVPYVFLLHEAVVIYTYIQEYEGRGKGKRWLLGRKEVRNVSN